MFYTSQQVEILQKIEQLTQMQFCDVDYLENDDSIFAAYEIDEESNGLFLSGTFSERDEIPQVLLQHDLNSLDLSELLGILERYQILTPEEIELISI